VSKLAADEPRIRGIVAHAPLELGEGARPYLDALAKLPLVKGVRRLAQGEDVDFCIQPDFVRGVQLLTEYGFSFDHTIRHEQMEPTLRLAEQCPDVAFVLDHFGKPPVRAGELDPWRTHLRALASQPHVCCKLSGLATEADFESWTRDQLRPYIDVALDAFGAERVFYGGDWPVSTLAIGYRQWIDVLDWATQGLDDQSRRRLFADNAAAFYRLA
jgi:L-fuconolactonase